MAKPERLGIQEQLQRLRGSYDRLVRAVEHTADTVMITLMRNVNRCLAFSVSLLSSPNRYPIYARRPKQRWLAQWKNKAGM
jgi:hypothetical protein